jgi:hypothetical protein
MYVCMYVCRTCMFQLCCWEVQWGPCHAVGFLTWPLPHHNFTAYSWG